MYNNDTDIEIEATEKLKSGLKATTTGNANNFYNNNNNGNTKDKETDRLKRRKGNFVRIIVSNNVSGY